MRSGAAVGAPGAAASVGIDIEAELGGDDDLAAEGREGLADEFFVVERAVDFGGVKESDAALDGGAEQSDGTPSFRERLVGKAHAHAAQAEGGDLKIAS